MNPFLHDTVARPLADDPSQHPQAPSSPQRTAPVSTPVASRPARARRKRRPRRAALAAAFSLLAGVSQPARAIDVNTASHDQLIALRGIGPRIAEAILAERGRAGPFESIDELSDRVPGIGPGRAATLRAAGLRVGRQYRLAPDSHLPAMAPNESHR